MNDQPSIKIECPHCRSANTELASLFGQQLMTSQYYCRACATPFERLKDDDVMRDIARSIEEGRAFS